MASKRRSPVMFDAWRADASVMQHVRAKGKKNAARRPSWADAIATPAPTRQQADDLLAKRKAMFSRAKGTQASDVLSLRRSGRAALTWSEKDSARARRQS